MPLKPPPKCIQCERTESLMWRNVEIGEICNECYEQNRDNLKSELEPECLDGTGATNDEKKVRKSTRSTRFKSKSNSTTNRGIPKGKSRRCIFKKTPYKSPSVPASTTTCDNLFYKGQYFQVGDIVSLVDKHNDIYYAQIRGLMVDTYCEKSAFITWLIPTKSSPPPNEKFEPSTYLIGPDEDLARKLSCMEFVMNAPSNYYHNKDNPYPAPDNYNNGSNASDLNNGGFIWQNMIELN